jgi:hypothetical protein
MGGGAAGDYRARGLRACGTAGEREQGDVAGPLDGFAEPALMTGADTCHAARKNLAALLHELRKDVGALVVDEVHLLDTELADFLFAEVLAFAATRAARTATAGTGIAAWSAVAAPRATMTAAGTAVTATRTGVAAFATRRRAAWGWCLFLFL